MADSSFHGIPQESGEQRPPRPRGRRSRLPDMVSGAVSVFLGGIVGTLARILLSTLQGESAVWPWMTLTINLTGAFALGFLQESLATTGPDVGWRRLARLGGGTGFLGGYTTYGTFVLETDLRLGGHVVGVGVIYAVVSVLLGLALAGVGIVAGARFGERIHERTVRTASGASETGPRTPVTIDDRPNRPGHGRGDGR
ncbi:CrcB family protein [uncultured Bifidobacterium sp.]|uniref:fluoride efflux transporter FluC n=1 Tax=uncultured Bifidobacterium sp. TaxID=165187 RepID=UPI0028DC396C|nr:CrcB family protein [uncultured Bifidobacterium sp.]